MDIMKEYKYFEIPPFPALYFIQVLKLFSHGILSAFYQSLGTHPLSVHYSVALELLAAVSALSENYGRYVKEIRAAF